MLIYFAYFDNGQNFLFLTKRNDYLEIIKLKINPYGKFTNLGHLAESLWDSVHDELTGDCTRNGTMQGVYQINIRIFAIQTW